MKTEITVKSRRAKSGYKKIEAIVRGDWALHRCLDGPTFTITHVPSGFGLVTSLESCRKARECLKECAASDVKWDGQGVWSEAFEKKFKAIHKKYGHC